MSKVKLLLDVVNDIRHLADSLECVANSIVENTPESPCQEGDSSAKKHVSFGYNRSSTRRTGRKER